ncbi:molecular chaperone [Dyella monticola]|uniref:Molecular chaperone n=1 Tax=Dyella monticola TaxID=1927958 RepID=A0A370WTJ4_9GAMM|nr:fimbria/pilus periplasmic chaperone [Dyella monticola]RDS79327.1 molecular chaperone [Dyella monticola]
MRRRHFGRAVAGSACLLLSGALWAGSVEVSPVIASLSANHAIEAFTVRNEGQLPVTVQVSLMKWDQVQGKDVLTPTEELLSTPPLFSVAPGQSQILRVGAMHVTPRDGEIAYRMFLTEVPPPPQPGFRGLSVTLRLSIPIFIEPAKTRSPQLAWRVMPRADGGALVDVANSGTIHAKILAFSLRDKESKGVVRQDTSQYVLANNHSQWSFASFQAVRPGDHVALDAMTDTGEVTADLVVQPQ